MSLPKRAINVLLALVFIVGLMPSIALAQTNEAQTSADSKYDTVEGTFYLSVSDNQNFIKSEGDENTGEYIANMPIDLAEVSKIDLDDYGLGDYKFDSDGDGKFEITLLHVFIYANLHYGATGISGFEISDSAHRSWIAKFMGMDGNFNYYVDGIYPMDASFGEGMGATSDVIEVEDGGFCNLGHFSSWSFYSDSNKGFRYFMNDATNLVQDNVTLSYNAIAGEDLTVSLARAVEAYAPDGYYALPTTYEKAASGTKLYYGDAYTTDVSNVNSVSVGEDGTAKLKFDNPGTYYIWMPGQYGTSEETTTEIVAAPTLATIYVHEYNRLGGEGRYDTMQLINNAGFGANSCSDIVLASGSDFPDALCASSLAGALYAPIVTTDCDSFSTQAKDEIQKLAESTSTRIWIMGGEAAVSEQTETEIKNLGYTVERLSGPTRFDTCQKIMEQTRISSINPSETVIITSGSGYADSLSIGSWAYASKSPIVIVDGGTKALSSDQISAIKDGDYKNVLVVGGDAVVDFDKVQSDLGSTMNYMCLSGSTRLQTSEKVVQWTTGNASAEDVADGFEPGIVLSFDKMGVACANGFADSLAAAGLLGQNKSCLLLVDDSDASKDCIDSTIGSHPSEIKTSYILGGTAAVSKDIESYIKSL